MNLKQPAILIGQSNSSPLTRLGEQQAAALGRHLSRHLQPHTAPAFVVASTAVRARATARIALEHMEPPAPEGMAVDEADALLELDQGDWEGAPRSQCYTPEVLTAMAREPLHFKARGGESQSDVERRVVANMAERVMPRLEAGGPPAVVVAHGLSIKCFLRHILGSDAGMTSKIGLENTAVVEVGWVGTGAAAGWHVGRINDTPHLVMQGVQF